MGIFKRIMNLNQVKKKLNKIVTRQEKFYSCKVISKAVEPENAILVKFSYTRIVEQYM